MKFKFITDYIDEMCRDKYGHTKWAFEHTMSAKELSLAKRKKQVLNVIPTIVIFKDK
tara:strand:+ start:4725 stop:4895 length:171 start_codon:yes stop_codon:yes gene_type:complete